jgi:nitrosocyanin
MTRSSGRSVQGIILTIAVLFLTLVALGSHATASEVRKFTLINVIFDGTKIWLPSSLIVHQGDTVELTLITKLDAPHGFKIADFGIEEVVQPKAQTTVRFTATTSGLHAYTCQMHPPHIGGQILVLSAED